MSSPLLNILGALNVGINRLICYFKKARASENADVRRTGSSATRGNNAHKRESDVEENKCLHHSLSLYISLIPLTNFSAPHLKPFVSSRLCKLIRFTSRCPQTSSGTTSASRPW